MPVPDDFWAFVCKKLVDNYGKFSKKGKSLIPLGKIKAKEVIFSEPAEGETRSLANHFLPNVATYFESLLAVANRSTIFVVREET